MSSIANAKAAMGFTSAKQRPACNNCKQAEERQCVHPTWWCDKGDFLTSPMSICEQYQPRDQRAGL